jgi:hypothetical protein
LQSFSLASVPENRSNRLNMYLSYGYLDGQLLDRDRVKSHTSGVSFEIKIPILNESTGVHFSGQVWACLENASNLAPTTCYLPSRYFAQKFVTGETTLKDTKSCWTCDWMSNRLSTEFIRRCSFTRYCQLVVPNTFWATHLSHASESHPIPQS